MSLTNKPLRKGHTAQGGTLRKGFMSRKHQRCQHCGTSERAHVARGLCTTCYYRAYRARGKPSYQDGLEEGREEVRAALDHALRRQGGECRLWGGRLTLVFGGGGRLEVSLSGEDRKSLQPARRRLGLHRG